MTEETIRCKTNKELAELLGSVNYDRLGSDQDRFYVCLNPFTNNADFEPIFTEVSREVVEEYLCRLLVDGYEGDPQFNF